MVYNGVTYLYVLNLQGDVIRIISKTGETKAEYTYDAWGRILTATGDLAAVNPLRYRGYFYDTETGLYYLQSRYYDPTVKRFINADSYGSTGQGFLGYNMFAYCGNSPSNNADSTGQCYYDENGKWRHEKWEYTKGYFRKPAPAKFLGKTSTGRCVFIGGTWDYKAPVNSVRAVDYRASYGYMYANPSIQIHNSNEITDLREMYEIATMITKYDQMNPSNPRWDKSATDVVNEWLWHNVADSLFSSEHTQHVDLDVADGDGNPGILFINHIISPALGVFSNYVISIGDSLFGG